MRILLSAIYPYVFLLLYLIIPFDNYIRALPNILLVILAVAFPLVVKKEDFRKMRSTSILFFLGFLAYLSLNSFFNGRYGADFNILKNIMLAAGMMVLYIPLQNGNLLEGDTGKIKSAIIFSSLAAIVFTVYNFVIITDKTGSFSLGDSPQIIESLLIDRIYLGMLCVFSILISFQAISKKYHPSNNYYLANILVNLLFIILIGSKIALISLFVIALLRQFYGKPKVWKILIAVAATIAVVGLFLIIRNERLFKNYQIENSTSPPVFMENSLTYELRAVVWASAIDIIGDIGLTFTGIGFDENKNRLVENYRNTIPDPQKRAHFISERYNTHNQFLDFYISAGFIALLLFVVFILVSFISNRKRFFPTAMLSILILYCLVENPFNRQIGSYYVGFILIVLMTGPKGMKTTI